MRDGNTGFTFFNIEGHQYDYDPAAQSLTITGGRLLISKEFANALGRPSDAGAVVGKISIGAAMQPIEITQLANGRASNRWSCHPCNMQSVPESRTLCPARMSSLEISRDVAQIGKRRNPGWSGGRDRLL